MSDTNNHRIVISHPESVQGLCGQDEGRPQGHHGQQDLCQRRRRGVLQRQGEWDTGSALLEEQYRVAEEKAAVGNVEGGIFVPLSANV